MGETAGKIIIETELDSKKFDKQYNELETRHKNKKLDIELSTKSLTRAKQELSEMEETAEKLFQKHQEVSAELEKQEKIIADATIKQGEGKFSIKEGMAYQYDRAVDKVEQLRQLQTDINSQYEALTPKIERQEALVEKITTRSEKQKNDLKEIVDQMSVLSQKQNYNALQQMNISIQDISKNLKRVIRNVIRWGLAIFGIRGAYMAVRNAINVISQDDAQLKADIEYMRTALAYTLEPIVRRIVDLAKQLFSYIAYIIKAWTGKDIFANANKHLQSANKSANQLRKTLTGFDEMNILNDNVSGGGGGTADAIPDIPKATGNTIIEWIAKNKIKVLSALAGLVAGITAVRLGLGGIKALGIGIAVYGLLTAIDNLIKFIKNPAFDTFTETLKGIALAAVGVGLAIEAWPVLVAGAIAYVVLLLVQNLDKIIEKFEQFNNWLDKNVLGWLKTNFGKLGEIIYAPFKNMILTYEGIFTTVVGGIKKYIEGIVKIFKGDLIGGLKLMFSGLAQTLLGPFIVFYNGVMQIFRDIRYAFSDLKKSLGNGGTGSYGYGGSGGGRAKGGIFYPSKLPKLAVGGIINQPGRGVPYHGAIIGERGAEAVVPLTDSQQMTLLGEAIGKYISINATVPVYVGNRMVAREMRRIEAEDSFASNR